MYSNCYCSCSFEAEIIKFVQSSHMMYSNNILNFQETKTILNACTKKVWKPIECTTYMYKKDLALNNLHLLIFHKIKINQTTVVRLNSSHGIMFPFRLISLGKVSIPLSSQLWVE